MDADAQINMIDGTETRVRGLNVLKKGRCYILAVTGVLMVASMMLISSNDHISTTKPCELKKALDSIDLKYSFQPCKYNALKENSIELFKFGKGELSWNFCVFLGILVLYFAPPLKHKLLTINILIGMVGCIAFLLFILSLIQYNKIVMATEETTNIDYSEIESALLEWLQKHYTSDDMNDTDEISKRWNTFFIQYDCCAVREIQGTTNDFDKTPWCTKSGSCRATTSKIPKTCCKDVTKWDYQNAPSACYASMNLGTYKSSCYNRLRALSYDNISEYDVSIVSLSLLTLVVLQIFESALIAVIFFPLMWKHSSFCNRPDSLYHDGLQFP